jgi:hypothetical protein
MSMRKNTKIAAFAVLLLTLALSVGSTYGFLSSQSSAGADFIHFEGVAANDHYDNNQYSYLVNQWSNENYASYSYDPSDAWFMANKSLRLGMNEFGEFATPLNNGIAYGADSDEWADTESWASSDILEKYWIQGWTLYMNYTRQGILRCLEAYAIYSDLSTAESARKVYTWYGDYESNNESAVLTEGSLSPSGVWVLYDSARLGVARADVTIRDGYYDEDVAKVVLTIIFDKTTKYAIVLKDVKILLDPKVIDLISDFAFSERYELDMARGINPSNEAFVHYFSDWDTSVYQHPVTGQSSYDVIQAFDPDETYIFFSGVWPQATEYTVYNPLVPNLPLGYTRVLPYGEAVPDIPNPPDGPGEASTPWIIVQWRYNNTDWSNLLQFLAKSSTRQIRFVEVIGMTDFTDNPHPAMDIDAGHGFNDIDVEVAFLLAQVFEPEDLTTVPINTAQQWSPFMWTAVGQSAATTDSGGAGYLAANGIGQWMQSMILFDRNDTMFPWTDPVVGMKGSIPYGLVEFDGDYLETFSNAAMDTGADPTDYVRTALKGFAFDVYDDAIESPPQPIAGGWSDAWEWEDDHDHLWWYPSKDPLTERWEWCTEDDGYWYDMPGYDDIWYSPNGIITLGGVKANGITRYFNDFMFAITREGTDTAAVVNGGSVSGSAPTSDPSKPSLDFFPVSTWDTSKTTFGMKEGYAVITLGRDTNGTRGLIVTGWDGRDTFWASAWASQWIVGPTGLSWIPQGAVAVIINIEYNDAMEPEQFNIAKVLGTITEFGDNKFSDTYSYDMEYSWMGDIVLPEDGYPYAWIEYKVWWWEKLYTESDAHIQYDP